MQDLKRIIDNNIYPSLCNDHIFSESLVNLNMHFRRKTGFQLFSLSSNPIPGTPRYFSFANKVMLLDHYRVVFNELEQICRESTRLVPSFTLIKFEEIKSGLFETSKPSPCRNDCMTTLKKLC